MQIVLSLPELISAQPEVLGRVDPLNISGLTGTEGYSGGCVEVQGDHG